MLPADEQQALVDDINANGLQHPLLIGRALPNGSEPPWVLVDDATAAKPVALSASFLTSSSKSLPTTRRSALAFGRRTVRAAT
jgi:hypothetical protein